MTTLTAACHSPIQGFYDCLKSDGKRPKVALVASMGKRLTTLNAMVKTNKSWDKLLHGA